jgi:hypothetical protein
MTPQIKDATCDVNGLPPEGWLPVELSFAGATCSVKWMRFNTEELREPFFHQTIARLRRGAQLRREAETDVDELLNLSHCDSSPAGLIFHISRCGSTLIANALRCGEGTRVLSEAEPVGSLLRSYVSRIWPFPLDRWEEIRGQLLQNVVTAYAEASRREGAKLIIKFSSTALLSFPFIRAVWPQLPCLIVIREPIEVMVSNLQRPGGWMFLKHQPLWAGQALGLDQNTREMSAEEYCGRVLGNFLCAATAAVDPYCKIVDYSTINDSLMEKIASLFSLSDLNHEALHRIMSANAKDPRASIPFRDDSQRKQISATDAIKLHADRWARKPYERLKRMQAW